MTASPCKNRALFQEIYKAKGSPYRIWGWHRLICVLSRVCVMPMYMYTYIYIRIYIYAYIYICIHINIRYSYNHLYMQWSGRCIFLVWAVFVCEPACNRHWGVWDCDLCFLCVHLCVHLCASVLNLFAIYQDVSLCWCLCPYVSMCLCEPCG